ncbi:MAG TPA: hypothetical protein DCE80_13810, partial [Ignavibacteriales bacterium]|nr:hypothetical protein [Ignavibacteriales bacterium]
DQLRLLLNKYEDMSKRYTSNFPDLTALQSKISDLTGRMKHTIESELSRQQNQVWDLQKQSSNVIGTIRSAEVNKNQNEDIRSTYEVYN